MRYMGWTWREYCDTPESVIDRLIETINTEAKNHGTGDDGPRAAQALNR